MLFEYLPGGSFEDLMSATGGLPESALKEAAGKAPAGERRNRRDASPKTHETLAKTHHLYSFADLSAHSGHVVDFDVAFFPNLPRPPVGQVLASLEWLHTHTGTLHGGLKPSQVRIRSAA